MFRNPVKAFFVLFLLSASGIAAAQTSLPNGFTESPQCVVKASDWQQPDGTTALSLVSRDRTGTKFYHQPHTILSWYYGGLPAGGIGL